MRALFCYDHVFVRGDRGEVYSHGAFTSSLWDRYLEAFDGLVVVSRGRPLRRDEVVNRLNIASAPGVSFVFVPDLSSVGALIAKGREAARILGSAIADADGIIVRLPSEIGLRAARIAARVGKPCAAEVVGCPWDALWNHGAWQGKAYAPLVVWRMRRRVARTTHTVYVTRDFLQRRYPARGDTASVSDVEIPVPDPNVLECRLERIGRLSTRPLIFGLVGSIMHRNKGVHTALAALAKIRREIGPFEFRVLGPGDPEPLSHLAARLGIDEQVRFCGTLPSGSQVLEWLDDVDIYLQPSLHEGLPRALVEAMSRGCLAIGSTAGGIPELLDLPFLHRPGRAGGLASRIRSLVGDHTLQLQQARRNFNVAYRYNRRLLRHRRSAFWSTFAEHIQRAEEHSSSATKLWTKKACGGV